MTAEIEESRRKLERLARNLFWTWDSGTIHLFRDLDPMRWHALSHNPLALLSDLGERLDVLLSVPETRAQVERAHDRLETYLHAAGHPDAELLRDSPIAYFSAEFGLHESMPVYSGGLGILAGDHLKGASDLRIPMVGVGLLYAEGYFRQEIDAHGWQKEVYPRIDRNRLPLRPLTDEDGDEVIVSVETRTGPIRARVFEVEVGRSRLLLLDSDVDGASPEDRNLTARLYGGDVGVRIRQEVLLGIGGMRALSAAGVRPRVIHLNEGHSAFAALERVRMEMRSAGSSFDDACEEIRKHILFTTHTPVPAGHDRFHADLVEEHLGPLRDKLGVTKDQLLGLGRVRPDDSGEEFCMTVLALKLSARANGVSELHGKISRRMWKDLWPGVSEDEVPISHITNGVHLQSWLSPAIGALYDKYFDRDWRLRVHDPSAWAPIRSAPDEELWAARQIAKTDLLQVVRERASDAARGRGERDDVVASMQRALSADSLLIGFARRFATYKRASLLLADVERLNALVNDPMRPIRIVFAGKAHPRDEGGKHLIQRIYQVSRDPRFLGKVLLLNDYDMNLGRRLVRGVDLWLNSPRRPLEACGTSGQKVVQNGGLQLSVLDGWWAEGYDGTNGFAIGEGEEGADPEVQDRADAEALYRALEEQIVPWYYDRGRGGVSAKWIATVKSSIATLGWRFSANRMLRDYLLGAYRPLAEGT